jgi:acyl-[acyl-carrier-protein]-phospholipid O-acyltransferase/long-chain-fatty-acid--[acyl-carrier-protein] ligase
MTRVIERMSELHDSPWQAEPPPLPAPDKESLPPLYQDRSFWGMTVTQFLGAFNDSVFKQIVLLLCTQVLIVSGGLFQPRDQQWLAQGIFAISFVLFSGVAGYWADRIGKKSIIVGCKIAEIGVMLAAVVAFAQMAPRASVQVEFQEQQVRFAFDGQAAALANHNALGGFALAAVDERNPTEARHRAENSAVVVSSQGEPRLARWGDISLVRPAATSEPQTLRLTQGIPWVLLIVLFLMGTHSAVFGPAKYGILPEMVRSRDLPRFNGIIQMTTFLALIFGTALGGLLLDHFGDALWKAGLVCAGIAVVGTAASFHVRRTPVAQPDARFQLSALAVSPDTGAMLWNDRPLMMGLIVYSLFWFVAAIVPMSINALGANVLERSAFETSLMPGSISIGIAFGCVLAGKLSADRVRFGLVRLGAWGMLICLLLLSLPGVPSHWLAGMDPAMREWLSGADTRHFLGYGGSLVALAAAGLFAGFVAVPLQVYLQAQPPETLKGRMIGTMNLINWIGIILSAGFYFVCQIVLEWLHLPTYLTFGATALILFPIALLYRPADVKL